MGIGLFLIVETTLFKQYRTSICTFLEEEKWVGLQDDVSINKRSAMGPLGFFIVDQFGAC